MSKNFLEVKNVDFNIDKLIFLDDDRKSIIVKVEQLKSERNIANKEISELRKNNKDSTNLIQKMKSISSDIKDLDLKLNSIESKMKEDILYIPNVIDNSVPVGDEKHNKIIKEWGERPTFDYDVKGHKEISEINELIDFKRAVKMSGSGFPLYTKYGAKLERGLINFMLNINLNCVIHFWD